MSGTDCSSCSQCAASAPSGANYVVALAGNPNTGKSTVFNALTGMRQHTGNWPGKTVVRAEGTFSMGGNRYRLVDLPGTYSLFSTSPDEQAARDFLLFGKPHVTVVVVDATRLERNLNLLLQVLEITPRVVVCLNLVDEARRHGVHVDARQLARDLGVPVVETAARQKRGLPELLKAVSEVASGALECVPRRLPGVPAALGRAVDELETALRPLAPAAAGRRWLALRLLAGDESVMAGLQRGAWREGSLDKPTQLRDASQPSAPSSPSDPEAEGVLRLAATRRGGLPDDLHETLVGAIFAHAGRIAHRCVTMPGRSAARTFDRTLDAILTSRTLGLPVMALMLGVVLWLTIAGANIPSAWMSDLLVGKGQPWLRSLADSVGLGPWWTGLLVDGAYLATAWVVSVMLPPMAIFFPLFTLLEDFGYLPRVAFNLDGLFRRVGAHGKQAMSLAMGFGCNAAGVVAARIIDSPRERLVAIVTNNFSLCNGRWPTQFLIASIFIGPLVPEPWSGALAAVAVTGVVILGVACAFGTSWLLTRTVLRGQVSTFSLELPPYRPPRFWQTLVTSLRDRTLIVLWRAVVFAMPAGVIIWLVSNTQVAGDSLAAHAVGWLDPMGVFMGLNGVILLAYVVAIPANEIVIPTVLMLTVLVTGRTDIGAGAGVMFEMDDAARMGELLRNSGWTLLTAVNLMLFSLLHNPCSTTIYTIQRETRSIRWTLVAVGIPLALGFGVTSLVAFLWRL